MKLEDIRNFIIEHADEKKALFDRKIIQSKKKMYGVKTSDLKKIAKLAAKEEISFPRHESYEMDVIRGLSYAYSKHSLEEKFLFFEQFMKEEDNWAAVDILSSSFSIKANRFSDTYIYSKKNILCREEEFLVRFSYLLFLHNFKKKEYMDTIFTLIREDDRYYVMMAEAWLLSSFFLLDAEKVYQKMEELDKKNPLIKNTVRKIFDSYRVSEEQKNKLRSWYDENRTL